MAKTDKRKIQLEAEVAGLDDLGKLSIEYQNNATKVRELTEKMGTYRKAVEATSKELQVNRKIARRFVTTSQLAGFTAEEQAIAMQKIAEVAQKTGKPIAIVEKAYEGLARTLQNATQATENLEDVFAFQGRAGIPEAEKAAAKYAQTLGGGTDALRALTGVGEIYAKQLDQIRDANLKEKLTTELARKELRRKRDAVERMKDSYLALSLRIKSALGPTNIAIIKRAGQALKGLAMTVGVALAGAFALAVASIKKFAETNKDVKRDVDLLEKSVDRLQVALGSALVGGSEKAGENLDALRGFVDNLTKAINENAKEIHALAVAAINSSIDIFEALVSGIGAYGKAIAFTIDNLELLIAGLGSAIVVLGGSIAFILHKATNEFKLLAQGFIKLLDLLGAGDKVPASMRNWSQSIVGLGDVVAEVDKLGGDMFKRLSEGWKNTRGVDDYQKRVESTLESLKALRDVRTGKATSGTYANVDEEIYEADWMDDGDADEFSGTGGKSKAKSRKQKKDRAMAAWLARQKKELRDRDRALRDRIKTRVNLANLRGNRDLDAARSGDNLSEQEKAAQSFQRTLAELANTAKDTGKALLVDFGGNAARAFGAALASGQSMGTALGDVFRNTVAQAASEFGRLFVLKGAALALEAPQVGIPMIAAGLALQALGGGLSAGGRAAGSTATPSAAALSPAFRPRGGDEDPRETIVNVTIAGDQIRDPIIDVVREGIRTRRLSGAFGV